MLHTKFHGNRSTGSGEENFEGYHIWAWRPSWSCDPDAAYKKFRFPLSKEDIHKFGFDWPSGFGEEDVWKCERTEDGRPDHVYTISSPLSLRLRWAKNGNISIKSYVYHFLNKSCGNIYMILLWNYHFLNKSCGNIYMILLWITTFSIKVVGNIYMILLWNNHFLNKIMFP